MTEFLVGADFVCHEAAVTGAMLRGAINPLPPAPYI